MPARLLYRFDSDEAPATYWTNYLITAICWIGVAVYLLKRPTPLPAPASAKAFGRYPPAVLLIIHLSLYGVVMLIGGLGHQVWIHNQCPGREMPANVTIPCPNGLNNEPVISTYLFFLGPCQFQLAPLWISLSGFAHTHGYLGSFTQQVYVCQFLGLAIGITGAVLGHSGFLILGVILVLFFLTLLITVAIGLCVEKGQLVAGKALVLTGSLISLVGMAIQQGFAPVCGAAAYRLDGVSGCPFGGNGITGLNHNAVFHIVDAAAKLVLVVALFFLRIEIKPEDPQMSGVEGKQEGIESI